MVASVGSPKAASLTARTAAMSSGCSGRKVIILPLKPNAERQARVEAEAQRALEGFAWTPLLEGSQRAGYPGRAVGE
jgi:hypothetical protein